MERAKRIDFDFFLRVNPKPARTTSTLSAQPITATLVGQNLRVRVGKNLMSYSSQLTLNKQVASVTVQGWDPTTKSKISYKATAKDLPETKSGGTNGPKAAEEKLASREDIVVDQPVASVQEARDLAISRCASAHISF